MAGTDRCNHARNQCTQLLYSPYSPTYFVIARQAQSISIASHRFYTARFYTARLFGTSVVPVRVFRKRMMDTGCSHELGCRSVPPLCRRSRVAERASRFLNARVPSNGITVPKATGSTLTTMLLYLWPFHNHMNCIDKMDKQAVPALPSKWGYGVVCAAALPCRHTGRHA